MKKHFLFINLLLVAFLLTSCGDDDNQPTVLDAQVTISNTLQTAADPSQGGTGGQETPVEVVFGAPAGTFTITATVGDNLEFNDYLDGLYDINISEDQISYDLVAPADHPIYSNFFRTIEANTFDWYYFNFDDNHNISSGDATNSSVSLNVISDTEILVVIGEGFDFNPGTSFEINLK
ncbi:MAG: hypothetical protein AB8F74_08105 [Saprospiraceae bacterium]